MKRFLPLFACLLLLCGCGSKSDTETTPPTEANTAVVTEPVGLYDPDSPLEAETGGAIRCYPLNGSEYSGLLTVADSILLFDTKETTTELTVLSGETLAPAAAKTLDFALFPEDASIRQWEGGISYYDPAAAETVVLDLQLREVTRISAPAGLMGAPLLSYDRGTLYYCTDTALRVLDLDTGISRILKKMAYDQQDISALLLEETVLACSISDGDAWQILYISTETGAILEQRKDMVLAGTSGSRYYAAVPDGSVISQVFGGADGTPNLLTPRAEPSTNFFLAESNALVSIPTPEDAQLTLDHYDLDSGLCTASVTMTTEFYPRSFHASDDGRVWFLNHDRGYGRTVLCCWDPSLSPTGDSTFYGSSYFTDEAPDLEGLEACKAYAQQIGEAYGIEVVIYKDAVQTQPWDYDLEYEYLVPVIRQELEQLEQNLANYPEGFLSTLAQQFDGLSICIVRSLTGTAESGSLDNADGIQFMDGYKACIALAAGKNTEYALYHEMCHLIDTMVLGESSAYDRWDQLNPKGFEYDYDYIANQNRDGNAYLQDINRSFIDTYSMSFPKEDRARIMEYAMTEGNEGYFQSTTMQSKLKLLCEGIREAFGLKKSPETFLWEQYLNISLAYTK